MNKICVFGGTAEGRRIAELLRGSKVKAFVCVATKYGEELLPEGGGLTVSAKRLDEKEIKALFKKEKTELCIDATHPYAEEVSKNAQRACESAGVLYMRLSRKDASAPDNALFVSNVSEAVKYLENTTGNVLLTTGSREIKAFSKLKGFSERCFARVLPSVESIEECQNAGLPLSHIAAMQGPFSQEMNEAFLRQTNAAYLVTKEGGKNGGFEEKAKAAYVSGATLVVIKRPESSGGKSFSEVAEYLEKKYGVKRKPDVSVIGIGPGSPSLLTAEAQTALKSAECFIGAGRMLSLAPGGRPSFAALSAGDISEIIKRETEYTRFAILLSGDTGFYSGAKKLLPELLDCNARVFPGISSLSYLCSKTGVSYEDVYALSLHGRQEDITAAVKTHKKVFVLTGGENTVSSICETLEGAGLSDLSATVGERLSYADEKITRARVKDLKNGSFDPLAVMLIENENAARELKTGIDDGEFLREKGEKPVPMTKAEVRAVCISKLRLKSDFVVWDIGAGTGSLSIEAGYFCEKGKVYAVEKDERAFDLLNENVKKFGLSNVIAVKGKAPAALKALPAPDRVFIGGSSGGVRELVKSILKEHKSARVVATAVSLETNSELTKCVNEVRRLYKNAFCEAVCVNVSRGKSAGDYNLMTAQNPVYVFTFSREK